MSPFHFSYVTFSCHFFLFNFYFMSPFPQITLFFKFFQFLTYFFCHLFLFWFTINVTFSSNWSFYPYFNYYNEFWSIFTVNSLELIFDTVHNHCSYHFLYILQNLNKFKYCRDFMIHILVKLTLFYISKFCKSYQTV